LTQTWIAFLLMLSALAHGAAEPGAPVHVFLLVGQSNMAGRAKPSQEDLKPVEGILLWNDQGAWEAAVAPYNRYAVHRKKIFTGLNPGVTFARTYQAAHPGVNIGIVCQARGGTSIEQWLNRGPGNRMNLYQASIDAAKKAMESGSLKGILWHQGESNSDRVAAYPAQLKELIRRFREDLHAPDLPVVFSQVGAWREAYKPFNEMIIRQPANIPHTACVMTEGLGNRDSAHFDTAGQHLLGERFAAALERLNKTRR
jgi:hypothetical protein